MKSKGVQTQNLFGAYLPSIIEDKEWLKEQDAKTIHEVLRSQSLHILTTIPPHEQVIYLMKSFDELRASDDQEGNKRGFFFEEVICGIFNQHVSTLLTQVELDGLPNEKFDIVLLGKQISNIFELKSSLRGDRIRQLYGQVYMAKNWNKNSELITIFYDNFPQSRGDINFYINNNNLDHTIKCIQASRPEFDDLIDDIKKMDIKDTLSFPTSGIVKANIITNKR